MKLNRGKKTQSRIGRMPGLQLKANLSPKSEIRLNFSQMRISQICQFSSPNLKVMILRHNRVQVRIIFRFQSHHLAALK